MIYLIMPEEKTLELKDGSGKLSYTDNGGEGTPIILIHGFPLNQKIWESQVDALNKAGRRVITYDMRGFGKSSDPKGLYSHEEDLKQLIDGLSINECHLVGMSFGGEIATSFTVSNPQYVKELTLIGSGINGYSPKEHAPFQEWTKMVLDGNLKGVIAQILDYGELGKMKTAKPELHAQISKIVQEFNGSMFFRGCKRETPNPPIIGRLGEIKCKTNVIVGLDDSYDSLEQTRELATKIPNSNLELADGIGHFVNMERPGIVNDIIFRSEVKKEQEPIKPEEEITYGMLMK